MADAPFVCNAVWLGLRGIEDAKDRGEPRLSRTGSRVATWVIPTNKELMMAQHTRRLLEA